MEQYDVQLAEQNPAPEVIKDKDLKIDIKKYKRGLVCACPIRGTAAATQLSLISHSS